MEALHDWFVSNIFGFFCAASFLIPYTIYVLDCTKEPTPKNKKLRRLHYIWVCALVVYLIL